MNFGSEHKHVFEYGNDDDQMVSTVMAGTRHRLEEKIPRGLLKPTLMFKEWLTFLMGVVTIYVEYRARARVFISTVCMESISLH